MHQTNQLPCRAQSVPGLCCRPCYWADRSEGASALRKGSAHTRPAQGIGTSSMRQIQRKPLTMTKWLWLERTGSR